MHVLLFLLIVSVTATDLWQDEDLEPNDCPKKIIRLKYTDAKNQFSIPLFNDGALMDKITEVTHQTLSERIVHAKGIGAFGHFKLTRDLSDICKADFLNGVGKKTPVAVRLSTGTGERGSSDFKRDSRGWSIRWYTKDGNFDVLGFHTEMYFYKHAHHFSTIVRGSRRKPDSNLFDAGTAWDAITLVPESINFFTQLFADSGIPATYKNMQGHGIHTYQVGNHRGKQSFLRFHFWPNAGVKTVSFNESLKLTASDPDFAMRDLYESIKKRDFPTWTVRVQIIPKADCIKMGSRCIDVTRKIPADKYPHIDIGQIVLDKNFEHYQNDVEKLALCPGNLVDGIHGGADQLFEARVFAYRDAHMYRLGSNCNKIPVNCPLQSIFTYNRDGMPPVGDNEGDAPNYYPNSFGGPQPYDIEKYKGSKRTCSTRSKMIKITENPGADNFDQVAEFYDSLSNDKQQILVDNISDNMKTAPTFIKKRAINLFTTIHKEFGAKLAKGLNM